MPGPAGGEVMPSRADASEGVLYDMLVNYLVSMARAVEGAMNRALDAIVGLDNPRTTGLPGEVFLLEPRVNEMEILIDEHAIKLLRRGAFTDDEMRLIVASLKITNDLERIGDLAVNLAERVVSLREMKLAQVPEELPPMAAAVRAMVSKSLGGLIFRNVSLASQVLESDDLVDQYRDRIFEQLLGRMTEHSSLISPGLQFILATRHLERMPTTRPTSPRTSSSGCAAWTSAMDGGRSRNCKRYQKGPVNRPRRLRRIHRAFIRT